MAGNLNGEITAARSILSGALSRDQYLSGSITAGHSILTGTLTHPVVANIDQYDGAYIIDALADLDTVLSTKRKFLNDDITVNKIKYIETTNPAGGQTVYIG